MKRSIHCHTCGNLLALSEHGRPRHYCSDACRRAADTARKAGRPKPAKPVACIRCRTPIVQKPTGRPRKLCDDCAAIVYHKTVAQHDGTALATVYVLFCRNNLYMIGFSRNVLKRQHEIDPEAVIKWTIQTQHPRRLEKALHQRFANWREYGEYFALEESDLRWIIRLGARFLTVICLRARRTPRKKPQGYQREGSRASGALAADVSTGAWV